MQCGLRPHDPGSAAVVEIRFHEMRQLMIHAFRLRFVAAYDEGRQAMAHTLRSCRSNQTRPRAPAHLLQTRASLLLLRQPDAAAAMASTGSIAPVSWPASHASSGAYSFRQ